MRKTSVSCCQINLLQPRPPLSFFTMIITTQFHFWQSLQWEKSCLFYIVNDFFFFFYNNRYRTKKEINKKISFIVYIQFHKRVCRSAVSLRIKPTNDSFQIYKLRVLHVKSRISIDQSSSICWFMLKDNILYNTGNWRAHNLNSFVTLTWY